MLPIFCFNSLRVASILNHKSKKYARDLDLTVDLSEIGNLCYNLATCLNRKDNKIKLFIEMNKLISPEIRAFLEKLLVDKKINVSGELKEQMISDLYDRLEVRFNQLIIEHLSVTELETLATKAEEGPEVVQGFLRKSIKNIDELFAGAMREFAQAYLEG